MTHSYDVVIIGAGPAGGECARALSRQGIKTALVEKVPDFRLNNFSSAGTPIETLAEFDLPDSVVGSYWNRIKIVSTGSTQTWASQQVLGAVMDFARLREYLARTAQRDGCDLFLGYRFHRYDASNHELRVEIKNSEQPGILLRTKILVDATGPQRAVMSQINGKPRRFVGAVGLEYLIRTRSESIPSNEMQFLVGRRWVPVPGYAWIFPMEKGTYKIGIGCLSPFKGTGDNLKVPLERILNDYLKLSDYEILDVHGGILRYSPGQTDRYYSHASPLHAIAIGDSVSAINPLGGEGIRHGMHSARVAAKHIQRYLSGEQKSFKAYEKELKTHFGLKWRLSEIFAAIAYGWAPDSWRDRGIKLASHFSAETIMDVLFNYNFARIFKLFRYPSVWIPKR